MPSQVLVSGTLRSKEKAHSSAGSQYLVLLKLAAPLAPQLRVTRHTTSFTRIHLPRMWRATDMEQGMIHPAISKHSFTVHRHTNLALASRSQWCRASTGRSSTLMSRVQFRALCTTYRHQERVLIDSMRADGNLVHVTATQRERVCECVVCVRERDNDHDDNDDDTEHLLPHLQCSPASISQVPSPNLLNSGMIISCQGLPLLWLCCQVRDESLSVPSEVGKWDFWRLHR